MPSLNVTLMREVARARFATAKVPRGTNRDSFINYLDAMASALKMALDVWRVQATITDVRIMGPTASGGKLSLPSLDGLIRGFGPAGSWDPYTRAIAAGVHNQVRQMCSGATFPGLPLYPAFAAFPGPMAPPTPNVPTPLLTFVLPGLVQVSAELVGAEIVRKYPTPAPACADAVAAAIADGFAKAMQQWLGSQLILNMMGTGSVPSFAPPYVPVGPVVNGRVLPLPGVLGS